MSEWLSAESPAGRMVEVALFTDVVMVTAGNDARAGWTPLSLEDAAELRDWLIANVPA